MSKAHQILAKKISLESKWNQLFLENNCVTIEMNQIQDEIKKCRRELVASSNASQSYNDFLRRSDELSYAS